MDHEQHINMKFCFKLQKSAKETHQMLKLVYDDAAVTMKMVYKWFERFLNDCESVEDDVLDCICAILFFSNHRNV